MLPTLRLVSLVMAFVIFVLAAAGVAAPRGNLVAGGLAFLALAFMLQS